MGAWAQSILQGAGRAGNEAYDARQLGAEEQSKKLEMLRSQMALKELQQRMGLEPQEFKLRQQEAQRLQDEFGLRKRLAEQPAFLGFQKVGSRVLYGIQKPDGTVEVKEAEGFDGSREAQSIEQSLMALPPGVGQQAARAAVAPYIMASDYTGAMGALKPYLLQYGKSGLPGSVSVTDTTQAMTIDTPNGPMVIQVPKHSVTRRGVGGAGGVATPPLGGGSPSTSTTPLPPGSRVVGPAKPTSDEMRRADLAENMTENLNQLEDIATRRPELFGKLAGRGTQLRQFIGTNDPDVASLKAIHDFLGRASQGAHGMRAATGVAQAADAVMASFLNSADATKAAIGHARGSISTFTKDIQRGGASGGGKVVNYKIVNGELVPQ